MKKFIIKSYCKINLSLRVIKKLSSGYHKISSLITFCDLHDVISISKINELSDRISFFGRFGKNIKIKTNTVTRLLYLLRKNKLLGNQIYKINIKKNIPHGSGLGGGSSNAASLLNYFDSKMNLNLNLKQKESIARKIGFDVPISLIKKNTFLGSKKVEMLRLSQKFKFNLLIVYPNIICSTKKIYKKNKNFTLSKIQSFPDINNKRKLLNILKNESNDLEKIVFKIYPRIKKIISCIKSQKGCYFSRITGSGSACIGIFSSMKNAINAQKLVKSKYPKYWSVVSKTI